MLTNANERIIDIRLLFLLIFLTIIYRLLWHTYWNTTSDIYIDIYQYYLLITDGVVITSNIERVQHYKWNIGHLVTEVTSSRSEVAPRWLTEMRRETQLISLHEDINAVDNFMARSLEVSRACNDWENQTPLLDVSPPRENIFMPGR